MLENEVDLILFLFYKLVKILMLTYKKPPTVCTNVNIPNNYIRTTFLIFQRWNGIMRNRNTSKDYTCPTVKARKIRGGQGVNDPPLASTALLTHSYIFDYAIVTPRLWEHGPNCLYSKVLKKLDNMLISFEFKYDKGFPLCLKKIILFN